MKKLYILLLLSLVITINLNAENRYSFSLSTVEREVTVAEAVSKKETELYIGLEAFFSVDGWSGGDFQQGPVFTIFDLTNEDDSFSDYFYAGWQGIWEFRENLELIGSVYAVLERALYKNNENNQQLTITLNDGYGMRLALRVAIFDDFGIDIASAAFHVDENGQGNYTYKETSISLVWWF